MRIVILVSVALFIAAMAGGYSIIWYSQARAFRNSVKETIDTFNTKEKYITYDSIDISGFPANVYISVVKPHFKGRVDELLKAYGNTQPTHPFASMPVWEEDEALEGQIIFGISAFSDIFTIAISGNAQETSKIGAQNLSNIRQQNGIASCSLQMQRGQTLISTLWNYRSLTSDGKSFLENFRALDCNSAGGSTTDVQSKEKISSSGPFRLFIELHPQDDSRQMRFYIKVTDAEITPPGDAMIANYINALSQNYPFPLNLSVYGKQNIEIDFTYNGPKDLQKNDQNLPMRADLSTFDITNDVYSHHINFLYDNAINSGLRNNKLVFRSESNVSEQYDKLLQNLIRNFLQQAHDSQEPQFREIQAQLPNYTPDQLYSIIYPSIFSLHSLGKMVIAVDTDYKGAPDFSTGDLSINNVELSTTPYSVAASGAAKFDKKIPQNATFNLACGHCLAMIDDMAAYIGRLQKTVVYFSPEKAGALNIAPAQVDAVKKFLSALAGPAKDPADATTLRYALVSDPSGMSINGRNANDIAAMFNEYIRPVMPQPAPAAQPVKH